MLVPKGSRKAVESYRGAAWGTENPYGFTPAAGQCWQQLEDLDGKALKVTAEVGVKGLNPEMVST